MAAQYFTFSLKALKDRKIEENQIAVPVRKGAKSKTMTESLATIVPAFTATDINSLTNTLSVLTKVCNDALVEMVGDAIKSGKTSGVTPNLSDVVEYLLSEKNGSARFSKESISTWFDTYGKEPIITHALIKLFGAKDDIDLYSPEEMSKASAIADNFSKLFSRLSARKDKNSEFTDAEYKQLTGAWTLIKNSLESEIIDSDDIFDTLETKILVEFKPAVAIVDALF